MRACYRRSSPFGPVKKRQKNTFPITDITFSEVNILSNQVNKNLNYLWTDEDARSETQSLGISIRSDKPRIQKTFIIVFQRGTALRIQYLSSGLFPGLPCGGVPFHRRTEPRVNVRPRPPLRGRISWNCRLISSRQIAFQVDLYELLVIFVEELPDCQPVAGVRGDEGGDGEYSGVDEKFRHLAHPRRFSLLSSWLNPRSLFSRAGRYHRPGRTS